MKKKVFCALLGISLIGVNVMTTRAEPNAPINPKPSATGDVPPHLFCFTLPNVGEICWER